MRTSPEEPEDVAGGGRHRRKRKFVAKGRRVKALVCHGRKAASTQSKASKVVESRKLR